MYFYEVIEKSDLELVIQEFLTFCVDSPNINIIEQKIRNAIKTITGIEAITSNTDILIIEKGETVVGETCDNVYVFDTVQKDGYSIEANPWADTLGYIVDEKSLSIYGNERFAALILWEMTWFGFDESSIQETLKSWDEEEGESRMYYDCNAAEWRRKADTVTS